MTIYHFTTVIGDQGTERMSVLYPSENTNFDEALFATINELTNTRLPPGRILVICRLGIEHKVKSAYDQRIQDLKDRLRNTTHISVAPYGPDGTLADEAILNLHESGETWEISNELLEQAGKRGLSQIVDETNTILLAPPGYYFTKPSGREEKFFVRAGNMLRELGSLSIIDYLLLSKLPQQPRTIYIDSFTILSFALSLQATVAMFSAEDNKGARIPTIVNIHSYDKDTNLRFPDDENYLIIISASTSGNLARELINDHGAKKNLIVHLLGAGSDRTNVDFKQSCLYFNTLTTLDNGANLPKRTIDIITEEFAVAHGSPRTVKIGKPHIEPREKSRYADTFYQEHLNIMKAGGSSGYGPYAVFSIEENSGLGPEDLKLWLRTKVVHALPASLDVLLHLDDTRSSLLADHILSLLPEYKRKPNIRKISLANINDVEIRNETNVSIVIVAYSDPSLEGLTRASTSLRMYSNVFRHYVLAHAFPESMQRHQRMIRDLTMRSGGMQYGWSEFSATAVGETSLHASILTDYGLKLTDHELEQATKKVRKKLRDSLNSRLSTNSGASYLRSGIFFPKTNGEELTLRSGSVFFRRGYKDISQIVVYLAVCAAIQRARERGQAQKETNAEDCFDDNPFVRAVISPAMFSRYSDGILQAAFLRALAPSELDFSGSEDLSWQFSEITRSVLLEHHTITGEAALEFLAAVASRKVSLREDDRSKIKALVRKDATMSALWSIFSGGRDLVL